MSAEKHLSVQISELHFKDSMNFLSTSLDNLVNNLKKSKYDFACLKKHCKNIKNDTALNSLTSKGTYPYEYMNCVEKFNATELPKYQYFYSEVSG